MPNHTQEEWDALVEHATNLAHSDLIYQRTLYYIRAEQGLTTDDVAGKLGMTTDEVTAIESGDPTLSDLRRLALVLGVDVTHKVTYRKEQENDHTQSTDPGVGLSLPQSS